MKNKQATFIIGMIFLLLATTALSYGYFEATVGGNSNAKDMVVEAGTLKLTYTDGPAINTQNIKPGWTTTKTVSVKNNGTLDTAYNIVWQELKNTILKKELVLSATCTRLNASGAVEGTCNSIPQAPISDMTITKKISIESGITHKYTFTILFKETNTDQNYNQGKEFDGVLGIEESKTASPVSFSTDSWETIVSAVKSGDTSVYKVGDTKEVDLGTYGTHTLRVANTSTPSECSTTGFSQTACGFVLEFANIITTHNMNSTNTSVGGWPVTTMRTFVNNDIYNSLPSEIKNAIIDTTVVSGHGNTSGETNFTSTDKLYLLSTAEVWADTVSSSNGINGIDEKLSISPLAAPEPVACGIECDNARDNTRQLDYYKNLGVTTNNYSGAIKKNGTSAASWWLRSANSINNFTFFFVTSNGDYINTNANYANGVAPAFRLG